MFIIETETAIKFDVTHNNCLGGEAQCFQSMASPPTINITFTDKSKDSLDLTHEKMTDSSPLGCNYIGHLSQNHSSTVAVTGCLNKPGDKMEITLLSEKAKHSMFIVDYNRKTTALKGPFANGGFLILN